MATDANRPSSWLRAMPSTSVTRQIFSSFPAGCEPVAPPKRFEIICDPDLAMRNCPFCTVAYPGRASDAKPVSGKAEVEGVRRDARVFLVAQPLSMTLALWFAACESSETERPLPSTLPEGCQPLYEGWDCFLPYPSNHFLVPNDDTRTGLEVKHVGEGKLLTAQEYSADVNDWKSPDGFSVHAPILFAFDSRVDLSACVTIFDDKSKSTEASHCTLIIGEDGQAVPHFVDVDGRAAASDKQMIILRTLTALEPESRYVVAVQNLSTVDGAVVSPPSGFRKLRDGEASESLELETARAYFDAAVFPRTDAFGLERSSLQLAWDFTTGSVGWALEDLIEVRDLTLAWLEGRAPTVTIESVFEETSGSSAVTVYGAITGPLVPAGS